MPMAGVTAANYTEKAVEFAKEVGTSFEIKRDMTLHLSAWNSYFKFKAMGRLSTPWDKPVAPAQWRVMFSLGRNFHVPAEWPWQFDQAIEEVMLGDYANPAEVARLKHLIDQPLHPMRKKARPETTASAMKFLREAEVDHLPTDHSDRKKAVADWAKWYGRQRDPDAYRNMAANDPNRQGAPRGWTGAATSPAQGTARATVEVDLQEAEPAKKKWQYDPAKAHHYPMWWLLLTKEERWELQAQGKAPKPIEGDDPLDDPVE
jgi:hypothetical protein